MIAAFHCPFPSHQSPRPVCVCVCVCGMDVHVVRVCTWVVQVCMCVCVSLGVTRVHVLLGNEAMFCLTQLVLPVSHNFSIFTVKYPHQVGVHSREEPLVTWQHRGCELSVGHSS